MAEYYRIEVQDLAHKIKRWSRVLGYAGRDKERLALELTYFRANALLRGNTHGNKYRLVRCKDGEMVEVVNV